MAYMCSKLREHGASRLICSSGGNAGHAVAAMGRRLGMEVKVVVPITTKRIMLDKIRAQGADVTVHGANWNEADALAHKLVAADPSAEYIPPYEHELLWEGHSSIIDELVRSNVDKPGAIIASVGGGGLLNGLFLGLRRHGWSDVAVISAETDGANCFAAAFEAGKPVRLDAIDSIATSLGALQCSPTTLQLASEHTAGTHALTVSDAEAVNACALLLNEHRLLVEPACGAALAILTAERHRSLLMAHESVVVVVCGGSGVDWSIMEQWRSEGLWA